MRFRLLAACASLLAVAPAVALAQASPVPAPAPTAAVSPDAGAVRHITLPTPDGRSMDLSVWQAADERGVVVYSHGFNGSPEAYQRIFDAWIAHGFTVVAPLHTDSLRHPQHDRYDNRASFRTRLIDLGVARGYVQVAHAGKPMVVAGHSFGSLMSLIEAGALTVAGPLGDPNVKGVIAFSSAGDLQGVVTPDSYATLAAPLLMITGTADTVDGYVAGWQGHRGPFDRSPAGDKTLMVFDGGNHELVGRAAPDDFSVIVQATEDFLDAHALNDAAARARLAALSAPGVTIERR